MKTCIKIGFIFSLVIIASCKKEGCTDYNADNYNPSANDNDGSCIYSGTVTFWINTNYNNVDVTLNGVTKTISIYYPDYNPQCNDIGCATFTLTSGTYSFYAEENSLFGEVWSGALQFLRMIVVCTS